MELDDDDSTNSRNKKPAAKADDWTEVQGKHKTRFEPEAIATPLPDTPPRMTKTIQPPPIHHRLPINQNPPTKRLPGITPVHLNDGTLRITARWRPAENFRELVGDAELWNLEATDTIHYVLATVLDATLFPWMNGMQTPNIPSLDLTPDIILKYQAPRVTNIESLHMFVFRFRLCLSSGPGKWINNPVTKRNFEKHCGSQHL